MPAHAPLKAIACTMLRLTAMPAYFDAFGLWPTERSRTPKRTAEQQDVAEDRDEDGDHDTEVETRAARQQREVRVLGRGARSAGS